MKVQLEKGVWLADWEGDPGRTIVEENAMEFDDIESAVKAIDKARKYRSFPDATIVEDAF